MDDYDVPFAAYSALFRAVKNSMFINNKLSNKIVGMTKGRTEGNLEIFNEERLKSILFKEIKVSTKISNVVGNTFNKPLKEIKIPKLVKIFSILKSLFKY